MPHGIQGLPESAAAPRPSVPAEGLSSAEQQMIEDRFPASKHMTMRLYGPGQSARVIDAGAVGARLDLQG